jgi:hypothetical protein
MADQRLQSRRSISRAGRKTTSQREGMHWRVGMRHERHVRRPSSRRRTNSLPMRTYRPRSVVFVETAADCFARLHAEKGAPRSSYPRGPGIGRRVQGPNGNCPRAKGVEDVSIIVHPVRAQQNDFDDVGRRLAVAHREHMDDGTLRPNRYSASAIVDLRNERWDDSMFRDRHLRTVGTKFQVCGSVGSFASLRQR